MAERTCAVDDCPRLVLARGWCGMHYGRWLKTGDPLKTNQAKPKCCSIDDCTRPHLARGWCILHYGRWKKHGDPLFESEKTPKPTCAIQGCGSKALARGWCSRHYAAWRRTGDPTRVRKPTPPCKISDCRAPARGGRGWCETHYRRWQRHGDANATSRIVGDDVARFWANVDMDGPVPSGRPELGPCWVWMGALSADGYATMRMNRKTAYMARWAYEQFVAPMPDGHESDHLCRNRSCVNSGHLEAVTHHANILRGVGFAAVNARKTHCIRGHEFTAENTHWYRGGRRCRACWAWHDARRRHKA